MLTVVRMAGDRGAGSFRDSRRGGIDESAKRMTPIADVIYPVNEFMLFLGGFCI